MLQETNPADTPVLSICIPAYNAGRWIQQTIQSCLTDNVWPTEIVVSENYSTDDTAKVLEKLSVAHPNKIRVVRPSQHLSMAMNWNFALTHARGEFVLLLSADDLLTKGICDAAINAFRSDENIDVVSFEHDRLIHNGESVSVKSRPIAKHRHFITPFSTARVLMFNPLSINFSFFRWHSPAISRCKADGRLFAVDYLTTDYDFWIRATLSGVNVAYMSEPRALYRVHAGNLSQSKFKMLKQTVLTLCRHKCELRKTVWLALRFVMIRLFVRLLLLNVAKTSQKKRLQSVIFRYVVGW